MIKWWTCVHEFVHKPVISTVYQQRGSLQYRPIESLEKFLFQNEPRGWAIFAIYPGVRTWVLVLFVRQPISGLGCVRGYIVTIVSLKAVE